MTTTTTGFGDIFDPFGLDRYMRSRMQELFGPDFTTSFFTTDIPVTTTEATVVEGSTAEGALMEQQESRPQRRRKWRHAIPMDVGETDKYYVVKTDLCGVPKENIKVSIDNNHILHIEATPEDATLAFLESKLGSSSHGQGVSQSQQTPAPSQEAASQSSEQQGKAEGKSVQINWLLMERNQDPVKRSISIPKNAKIDDVQSCLCNGVLYLKFGKKDEVEGRRLINVE